MTDHNWKGEPRNGSEIGEREEEYICKFAMNETVDGDCIGKIRPSGTKSYLSVPGQFPLCSLTIGQLVDWAADRFGSSEALYFKATGERLSFESVQEETNQLACGFLKLGFQPGDRVGIWGPNSRQWYMTYLGLAKAGVISVFLNPGYQRREILYCLNNVEMKGIMIAGRFKDQNYYDLLVETIPSIVTSQAGQIKSEEVPTLTTVISMESTSPGNGVYVYDEVLRLGSGPDQLETLERVDKDLSFDDIGNIQFTSGTTGRPKGVMLAHHQIINNGLLVANRFQFTHKDKICLAVPLFHCYGSVVGVLSALHKGTSLVFPSQGYEPATIIRTAAEERCTILYGTPTMHIDMLNVADADDLDLGALRKAVTSGATCPIDLIQRMKSTYKVDSVDSMYGLTEASPVIFQSLPNDTDEERSRTVGYPLEHMEVKIVDKEGKIVPVGVEGEMCTRGFHTMRGYWGDPEKTRKVIDESRWFHSGDLVAMEPSGHVRIVGRITDMIIRGGENIYPREIEEFLHTVPGIVEAHVFGVPDERLGEVIAAWIRLKDDHEMTEADVRGACKGQISHFKIPKYIRFTKEFPKTMSGKVQKYKMRDITVALLREEQG